ncbi:MAG: hypothetical protein IT379_06030 [Deltaproteobacteria bacterium]|nr:hypothetical protein [Deltaproteobacteria bacterium]
MRFESPQGRPLLDRTRYRFVGARPEQQILVECRALGTDVDAEIRRRRARIESAGGRIESIEPLRVGLARVPHLAFVIDEGRTERPTRTRVHWAFPAARDLGCQPFVSVSTNADAPDDTSLLRNVAASVAPVTELETIAAPRSFARWQAGPLSVQVPVGYRLADTRRYLYESEDGRFVLCIALGAAGRDGEDFGVALDEAEVVGRREVLVDGRATFEVDYRVAADEGIEPLLLRVAEIELEGSLRLVVWARSPSAESAELERVWTQLLASIDLDGSG